MIVVKDIAINTIGGTIVISAIIGVIFLLLWFTKADWAALLVAWFKEAGFEEAGRADILKAIILLSLFIGFFIVFSFIPTRALLKAHYARASVSPGTLISMRIRRVDPDVIVNAWIMAVNAGLKLTVDELDAHYVVGGDVDRVVEALILAENANIPLSFEQAAAIDLDGGNVLEAVQSQKRDDE
ncbi:MAG: hypothetical protein GY801_37425 [bacterium]|nr:hypothetical protein [bacterium]